MALARKLFDKTKTSLIKFGDKNYKDLECPTLYVGSFSRFVQSEASNMKSIIRNQDLISLSANQMGSTNSFFIIRKILKKNEWTCTNKLNDFNTYYNPRIVSASKVIMHFYFAYFLQDLVKEYRECCPSFPGIQVITDRFYKIQVNYLNEGFKEKEESLEGFHAKVFQHELDHLRGITLLNWRLCHKGIIYLDNEPNDTNKEIKEVKIIFLF